MKAPGARAHPREDSHNDHGRENEIRSHIARGRHCSEAGVDQACGESEKRADDVDLIDSRGGSDAAAVWASIGTMWRRAALRRGRHVSRETLSRKAERPQTGITEYAPEEHATERSWLGSQPVPTKRAASERRPPSSISRPTRRSRAPEHSSILIPRAARPVWGRPPADGHDLRSTLTASRSELARPTAIKGLDQVTLAKLAGAEVELVGIPAREQRLAASLAEVDERHDRVDRLPAVARPVDGQRAHRG